ncbi:MAG: hypothetical protein CM15mP66_05470 [Pseudomonadota bacterium]|nr:MAG: hypothetical protein CM15mP66_05470 [Pseudomonadota bacterium]
MDSENGTISAHQVLVQQFHWLQDLHRLAQHLEVQVRQIIQVQVVSPRKHLLVFVGEKIVLKEILTPLLVSDLTLQRLQKPELEMNNNGMGWDLPPKGKAKNRTAGAHLKLKVDLRPPLHRT